ncbi:hypothetical protein DV737_g4113, partial [Chaetothyriales sp. CBS 132003]
MGLSAEAVNNIQSSLNTACADSNKGIPGLVGIAVGKDGKELFAHAAGKRGFGSQEPMTLDSVFWIASCTKMITAVAAMQLVEQGKLSLDDADQISKICPEVANAKVLQPDGTLAPQKKPITLRMLLTHTAGFGYTFFNEGLRNYGKPVGYDEFSGQINDLIQPLVNQPGEAWEYGVNLDWAGIVVERTTNLSLDEYFQRNIFQPLGIKNISFFPSKEMKEKLAYMNARTPDGQLHPRDHLLHRPLVVESKEDIAATVNSGGAGAFAQPREYTKILATLLNDGTSPTTGAQILKKETVDEMFKNQIPQFPDFGRQGIVAAKPDLTNPRASKTAVSDEALKSNAGKSDELPAQRTENIDPLYNDYVQQFSSIPGFANTSDIGSVSTVGSESLSSSGHDSAGHLEAHPWGNRILSRVTSLDEAYAKRNALSSSSQREASNVLNLAVMAFAAQWAQAVYQSQGNLRDQVPEHGVFERNMQKSLWHKANKALSRATSNPSFKVIFAAVIFAMTQRPMESSEVLATSGTPGQSYSASLRKIFELDTGTIFLDTAVRKLHDHRRKLQDSEQYGGADAAQGLRLVKEDDKQTFNLVFWLAIMCDTLVAAMSRRSFVLSDADTNVINEKPATRRVSRLSNGSSCDLDGYSTLSSADSSYLERESQIWGHYFLGQESRIGEVRKESARWPCSYTDAAACLADAAPVKVLLFRRAAHLQDLYYQRAPAEDIERAITSTLEVYIHWNNTYGCFISDCVAHHESLPARIQSWYTLLACHWHFAVLLVADLIDKLDEGYMTTASNRLTRKTAEFASALRFRSVYAISDISRCSRYNEELSFSQSPDFHHAVNRAALLTEPWTLILVRCFSHAGEVLVKVVLSQQQPGLFTITDDLAQARTRLDDCIQALRLLVTVMDDAPP